MQVRWTEYALDQLQVLVDELTLRRSATVRDRVVQKLLERVGTLATLPWLGPPWRPAADPTFRRLVVDDHVILYRVVEDQQTVFVLAVRHGRQRPLDPEEVPPA